MGKLMPEGEKGERFKVIPGLVTEPKTDTKFVPGLHTPWHWN